MPNAKVNKDVIERRYLQLKLNRDRRKFTRTPSGKALVQYVDSLKTWLKESPARTRTKGGLGR